MKACLDAHRQGPGHFFSCMVWLRIVLAVSFQSMKLGVSRLVASMSNGTSVMVLLLMVMMPSSCGGQ